MLIMCSVKISSVMFRIFPLFLDKKNRERKPRGNCIFDKDGI